MPEGMCAMAPAKTDGTSWSKRNRHRKCKVAAGNVAVEATQYKRWCCRAYRVQLQLIKRSCSLSANLEVFYQDMLVIFNSIQIKIMTE
ncbi:hypothetical protein WJX82_010601 [Trebouxia sp. C0006]